LIAAFLSFFFVSTFFLPFEADFLASLFCLPARADEIAQLNRFMPHSTDRKNTGKSIINQVCGMVRFPRNFR